MPSFSGIEITFVGEWLVMMLSFIAVGVYVAQNVVRPIRKIEKLLCDVYGDPDTGRRGLVQRVGDLEDRVDDLEK